MTIDKMIAVLQAAKAGKQIQHRYKHDEGTAWHDTGLQIWNFTDYDFRVKPEPREWWLVMATYDCHAFPTKEAAINFEAGFNSGKPIIKVREVLE